MNHLMTFLKEISLTPKEQEIVKQYKQNANNPLPLAEILLRKGYLAQGCELLALGIKRFPKMVSLRAAYARELFHQGLIQDSWQILQDSPVAIGDNLLANQISLQCAILLTMESVAFRVSHQLEIHHQLSAFNLELVGLLKVQGIHQAKIFLWNELKKQGINPILPNQDFKFSSDVSTESQNSFSMDDQLQMIIRGIPEHDHFDHFRVIPLGDVLHPNEEEATYMASGMDTSTMAKIFEEQGHFAQAQGILRRLVAQSPGNEFLRNQLAVVSKKLAAQKAKDYQIDPEIVDRMESLSSLDSHIHTLEGMLEILAEPQTSI